MPDTSLRGAQSSAFHGAVAPACAALAPRVSDAPTCDALARRVCNAFVRRVRDALALVPRLGQRIEKTVGVHVVAHRAAQDERLVRGRAVKVVAEAAASFRLNPAWTHVALTYPGSGTDASLHVGGAAASATVTVSGLGTGGGLQITGAAVDDLRVYASDLSSSVQAAGAPVGPHIQFYEAATAPTWNQVWALAQSAGGRIPTCAELSAYVDTGYGFQDGDTIPGGVANRALAAELYTVSTWVPCIKVSRIGDTTGNTQANYAAGDAGKDLMQMHDNSDHSEPLKTIFLTKNDGLIGRGFTVSNAYTTAKKYAIITGAPNVDTTGMTFA